MLMYYIIHYKHSHELDVDGTIALRAGTIVLKSVQLYITCLYYAFEALWQYRLISLNAICV
jgi:hypothetical protein